MTRLPLLLSSLFLLGGCVIYQRPSGWIPAREPLTVQRLAEMKRAGTSDAEIRKQLEFHGVESKLTAEDLVELKEAGAGDALLAAAATAPVKTPEEARPIYERHSHRAYDCEYCHTHTVAPFYFATALSLNYIFSRSWGRCR